MEHATRDEVELEHLVAQDHRVTRVVTALVAHHERHRLGEEVGRLALALIAPLEPDDHGRWHRSGLLCARSAMVRAHVPRTYEGPGLHRPGPGYTAPLCSPS